MLRHRAARPLTVLALGLLLGVLAGCGSDHDETDVRFAQQMIPHHAQAVEMAQIALDRADDPAVRELAGQVEAGQDPEIEIMTSWLEEWGEDVPHADGHDHGDSGGDSSDGSHGDMAGMMTTEDLDGLRQASGAAFDRRWLELMIEHHEGAIEMAETEQSEGRDADAFALAARIASTQQSEVDRMQALLDG